MLLKNKKTITTVLLLSVCIIYAAVYGSIRHMSSESKNHSASMETMRVLMKTTGTLQQEMNRTMSFVEFWGVFAADDPESAVRNIDSYGYSLIRNEPIIDSIQLAPDGIVQYIYPLEGNEAARGHNLLNDTRRKYFIEKTILTGVPVSQVPSVTKQGKILIFNRQAIRRNEQFWGLAIVSVDFEALMRECGMFDDEKYEYAVEVNPGNGDVFRWGREELLSDSSSEVQHQYVTMLDESWHIAVIDRQAGVVGLTDTDVYDVFAICMGIFLLAMTYILQRAYWRNKELATRDRLTGTLNHGAFMGEFDRYCNGDKSFCLYIIDLNDFKSINDLHGHLTGDNILIEVAERLTKLAGWKGIVSRFGGDEYGIIMPGIGNAEAAEKFKKEILADMERPIVYDGKEFLVKLSIGYGIYPVDTDSKDALYKTADAMMYEDKQEYHRKYGSKR